MSPPSFGSSHILLVSFLHALSGPTVVGQLRQVVIILPDQEGEISINRLGNQMTGVLLGSGVTLELGQGSRITSVPLRPSPQETYIRDTEINRSCQTGKTKMSLLKFMPLESLMPSALLILCHPFSSCLQSFPASGSFPMSQLFASGGQISELQL